MVAASISAVEITHTPKGPSNTQRDKNIILRDNTYSKQAVVTQTMAPNPLDHSYLLDINLKEVQSYRELLGEQDYYYPAKP